jgi:hypothetical protein
MESLPVDALRANIAYPPLESRTPVGGVEDLTPRRKAMRCARVSIGPPKRAAMV